MGVPAWRTIPNSSRRAGRSLGVRNYRLYFLGQTISSTGTWVQLIAEQLLILQLGGGALGLGVTMTMRFLPMLVLGPYSGAVVDRIDKRLLVTTTQSINGLVSVFLGFSGSSEFRWG